MACIRLTYLRARLGWLFVDLLRYDLGFEILGWQIHVLVVAITGAIISRRKALAILVIGGIYVTNNGHLLRDHRHEIVNLI